MAAGSEPIAEMLLTLSVASAAILGGTLATYAYDDNASLAWRLCAGACTGLVAIGMVGFSLASWFGLTLLTSILAAGLAASPLALLSSRPRRAQLKADVEATVAASGAYVLRPTRRAALSSTLCLLVGLVVWTVLDRVAFERPDGLYTGVTNNYGDLPFHLGVITRFALGENVPPEHPAYAGVRFTYSFLSDFVAAIFVRTGMSLRGAMLVENLVLAISLIGLLYVWARDLTRDRLAALLTPALVLLSGGLGWWLLVPELIGSEGGFVSVLAHLPHDYTIMTGTDWRWGNMITALLVPQRSIVLGLPVAIIIFTLWWKSFEATVPETRGSDSVGAASWALRDLSRPASAVQAISVTRRMVAAGVLTGLLPLVHAHSYAVVMAMGACLALTIGRLRMWVPFFAVSLSLSVPQIIWLAADTSVETERFVGWHLGWDHGNQNVLWFWLKNTGALIPLVLVAVFWRGNRAPVQRPLLRFYLPFTICFLIPNVLILAPWIWDNIKVLIYWHVASAPLVALVLVRLWRGGGVLRVVSAALAISLMLAGALDVWRVVSHASELRMFTREGIEFAELVRHTVPARSLILHAPTYNHPVFLSGRRSLMGYPGHVWSHGLPYASREADIRQIYSGAPEAVALIERYGVEYVVVGPLERDMIQVDDSFFQRFMRVGQLGSYVLFRTAPLRNQTMANVDGRCLSAPCRR